MKKRKTAKNTKMNWLQLVGFILICQAVGLIGSMFTTPNLGWYSGLTKPSFTPSGQFIGIVWVILFILMGIVLYRIWQMRKKPQARVIIILFAVQLIFNMAWSYLFFGLNNPLWGLFDILILLGMLAVINIRLARLDIVSGWLFFPYLLWVGFATVLNSMLWFLNS